MLFLDSANVEEIRSFLSSKAISGVTTNPSLVSKEKKKPYVEYLCEIYDAVKEAGIRSKARKHMSVEALGKTPEELFKSAEEISSVLQSRSRSGNDFLCTLAGIERNKDVSPGIVIKIPFSLENLTVISDLAEVNIPVNATACMNSSQALLASAAGASVVSFFYNRIKDGHGDPLAVISSFNRLSKIRDNEEFPVICGSIRSMFDVEQCWELGPNIAVTASAKIIRELVEHPQTTKAIDQFNEDIEKWLS